MSFPLQLLPAIDLKNGQCVRLRQGRMEDSTVFANDPVAMASQWLEQGCTRLHLVDLDGAFEGKPMNANAVHAIAKKFPDLTIQIGGGIRTVATVEEYLAAGVAYVIIGTQAVRKAKFVSELCQKFPGHLIVGIDAKDGMVAVEGWAKASTTGVDELAKKFEGQGVSAIVYTDILRDGMMQGVNVEATANLAKSISIPVIASGGVTNINDIIRLNAVKDAGIEGVIVGRALYEGSLTMAEAIAYLENN